MENEINKTYSDGTIEDRVYRYLKENNGNSADIIDAVPDGAVFHNFTPARDNLLRWYPFNKNSRILEIGAGMGALTPFFASVCEEVVALEPSSSRARIISERCRDCSNVQVVVQPLETFCGQEASFDYVTLIGVLEYAGIYADGDNPWLEMLKKARYFLKPGGRLLFAIENKFGLKYWCGAAEDHTGIPFDSISNYSRSQGATSRYAGNKGVRTFSKGELECMLTQAGYFNSKFYYALPDYKFPMLMLTDESESADVLAGDVKYGYPAESTLIANELKLYPEIIRNGVLGFFANSFLIEALNADDVNCGINTVTIKRDYRAKYRIITAIGQDTVTRISTNKESDAHIAQLIENTQFLQKRNIPCVTQQNYGSGETRSIRITAPRADNVFMEAVRAGRTALAMEMLDKLKAYLLMSSATYNRNGKVILETGYIDMTFRNSFWKDGDLLFFDQEWAMPDVSVQYILYRSIKYAMVHIPETDSAMYYRYCGITEEDRDAFESGENDLLQSLMDVQSCTWFDKTMYHSGLELESVIARKMENQNAHIEQLIESERGLQAENKCKEGHIEQLLQRERELLAQNRMRSEEIQNLQYELGYQSGIAETLQKSEAELRRLLEEAYSQIDRLQYRLGAGSSAGNR